MIDELTIHVGRGWTDSLGQIERHTSHEELYHAAAYVDVAQGVDVLFEVARPVRVLPFVFSWIDQLMRAVKRPARTVTVGDGDALFSLTVEDETVTLHDDSQDASVPVRALLRALQEVLRILSRDLESLAHTEGLFPIYEQLLRASGLVERALQTKPPRRHRPLHTARSLQSPTDATVAPQELSDAASDDAHDAHASFLARVRARVQRVQFLSLAREHLLHLPSPEIKEVFFDDNDGLIICTSDAVQIADACRGAYREVLPGQPASAAVRGLRHVDGCVLFEQNGQAHVLLPGDGWSTLAPLHGARHTHRIRGVVTTTHEVLAYVRGTTVYDAPSGVPLLHEVSALIPRHNADGAVAGWYALDRTRGTIWWDGEGQVAPFCTIEGACVQIVSCRHGVIAHIVGKDVRRLQWIQRDGTIAWSRTLPFDVAEFRNGGTLHVHADSSKTFGVHVVAAFRWWAFRIHVRTRLATYVGHGQEKDAVRLHWADDGLVCASGERLCVFPLLGRTPPPIWEDRIPKALGLLAPVFPLSVRGELLVHTSEDAVVRRVADGKIIGTYNDDWSAVFDCRLTPSMDLIIAAAVPGRRIDLYHAAPMRWLGLVSSS